MKCSLCGTELVQGNNTCPSCGALNMSFDQETPNPNASVNTSAMVEDKDIVPTNQEEILEEVSSSKDIKEVDMPIQDASSQEPNPNAGYVDLDAGEAEVVNATADMAAPELAVEQENLTGTAQDITSSQNVSTYDPTQAQPEDTPVQMPKEAGVNFKLPEVKENKTDTQGMNIMQIETKGETVGVEEAPVKEKFSLKIFKKKTLPRNLVLILLGVVLVIGILIGSTLFGKQVYTPSTNTQKKVTIQHVADGKNNTTYAGKFIYKIPNAYDFDKTDNGILIYGPNDEYRLFIKAVEGSYEDIANAKDSIAKSLGNIKITVNKINESVIDNNKYVVIEATTVTRNRLYAVRDGSNDHVFYLEIVTPDSSYNYDAIDVANDIINNVEFNDKYSTVESISNEDASKMIITASIAHMNA